MPVQPGQSLLHYRILEKLGEGGMGQVWKALDTTPDREARVVASLNHPHIASIYSVRPAGGLHFVATEFVPGGGDRTSRRANRPGLWLNGRSRC